MLPQQGAVPAAQVQPPRADEKAAPALARAAPRPAPGVQPAPPATCRTTSPPSLQAPTGADTVDVQAPAATSPECEVAGDVIRLPRRGRWSTPDEILLLTAYKDYKTAADVSQTRKTVTVEKNDSDTETPAAHLAAAAKKVKKLVKKRTNISQDALKREAERWKFVAGRFTDGPVQKPTPDQCSTEYTGLKAAYLAIARINSKTGGKNYWTMSKDKRRGEQGLDKNLPGGFSFEVWELCEKVIGSQEQVRFSGAISGDSGRVHAAEGGKLGKGQAGGSDASAFIQVEEDGSYNWRLSRCRAEQGMDFTSIMERRRGLGERYEEGLEPDEDQEKKKRDDEQHRDSLSSGHRRKVGEVGVRPPRRGA